MWSSKRGLNTGLFPEDNGSEDSGNVTSESELDMNAEVPSQVLVEMGAKNETEEKKGMARSLFDFIRIGSFRNNSQDDQNK